MPSLLYSSCSRMNMWWLKNCCSFSLVKLMHSCSKLLSCSERGAGIQRGLNTPLAFYWLTLDMSMGQRSHPPQRSQNQQYLAPLWSTGEEGRCTGSDWSVPRATWTCGRKWLWPGRQRHSWPTISRRKQTRVFFAHISASRVYIDQEILYIALKSVFQVQNLTCSTFCPFTTYSFPTFTLGWRRPLMRSAELTPIRYEALSAPGDQTAGNQTRLLFLRRSGLRSTHFRCRPPPPAPPAAFVWTSCCRSAWWPRLSCSSRTSRQAGSRGYPWRAAEKPSTSFHSFRINLTRFSEKQLNIRSSYIRCH